MAAGFAETGAAAVAAGVVVVGAFYEISEQVSKTGTQLDLMRQRLGTSAEELSGLGFAARQNGVEMDTLARSMQIMSRNLSDLSSPTNKAKEALETLGISTREADGQLRDSKEIMLDVADAFSTMKDGTEKTAEAMAIFGRGGAQLIPFLNEGREGIEELTAKAKELGIVFSDEDAKAAHEYEDAQNSLNASFQGLEKTIAQDVMPTLKTWIDTGTAAVKGVKDWTEANPGLAKTILEIAVALVGAGGFLIAVAAVIAALPLLTAASGALLAAFTTLGASIAVVAVAMGAINVGNMIRDFHGLGEAVDGFAESWTKQYLKDAERVHNYSAAMQGLADATGALHDRVKALGGPDIQQGNKTLEEWNTQLIHAMQNINELNPKLAEQREHDAKLDELVKKMSEDMDKQSEAAVKQAEAMKKAKEANDVFNGTVQLLVDQVVTGYHEVPQLEAALVKLTNSGATSAQIVAGLGDHIKAASESMTEQERALNPLITDYDNYAKATNELNEEIGNQFDAMVIIGKITEKNAAAMGDYLDIQSKANIEKVTEAWKQHYETMKKLDTERIQELDKQDKAAVEAAKKRTEELRKDSEEIGRFAGKIWDDVFEKGANIFTEIQDKIKTGVLSLGKTLFEDIAGALGGPIKQAFDDFFKGLISGSGLKSIGQSLADTIRGALGVGGGGGGVASNFVGPLQQGSQLATGGLGLAAGIPIIGGAIALGSWIGSLFAHRETNYEKWADQHAGWRIMGADPNAYAAQIDNQGNTQAVSWYDPSIKYEMGTPYVPQTGLYMLHQGERVTTANENLGMSGAAYGLSGSGSASGSTTIHVTFSPNISALDQRGVKDAMQELLPAFISAIETNVRGNGDRMRQVVMKGRTQ
jgi:hypothetical protein